MSSPVEQDGAAGGVEETRDHADSGRFAGSVGAEEAEDVAGPDAKVDVPHPGDGRVVLRQPAGLEHGVVDTEGRGKFRRKVLRVLWVLTVLGCGAEVLIVLECRCICTPAPHR